MNTTELIAHIKEERSRLLKKRPALEVERCHVLSEVDKAQFMTFATKELIHAEYNNQLDNLEEDIAALTCRLKELGEHDVSVES